MTEQDLTDGKIGIEVGLAILRPGEFIVFKFFHQKQKD
jgi:phage tail sheath protein FI